MRKEKTLLLDEIKDKIDASTGMIVTSYDKLEPNLSWKLRELLGNSGCLFEVVRKRVFLKAAEKSGINLDESNFAGHIGVVFVNKPDTIASAKVVIKFSKENANLLKVLCGQIDGKMMPGTEVEMLAELPGIDEMRAIMLGLFTSPMAQMLSVLEAKFAQPLSDSETKSES